MRPIRVSMKLMVLVLCILAPLYALAEQSTVNADTSREAREILEKMTVSARRLNYDGVFVYSRGDQLDSMRIIHKVDESGEVEKLISLTGSTREVIRNNDDVTCIFSDNKTVMVDKGSSDSKFLPSNLPESIEQISAHYTFSVMGDDRIAARPTRIVQIMPKDEHRYIYRIWIDAENFLVLKSTVIDMQDKTLETVLFTHIDTPDEIPSDMMSPMNASDYSWYTNEQHDDFKSDTPSQWRVQWLPSGFLMKDSEVQKLSTGQQPREHLVYSDGLATVSLFIEKLDNNKKPMNGFLSLGAVNAFTTSTDNYQVTAVGELPAQTVHKIASSVIHNK